jgi:hypothetical protein
VSEWSSPTFRSPVELLFLALLSAIVVAARRGARWRALLPALVFLVAGLMAVRNLGIAALVIAAMTAPSLAGLAGELEGLRRGFAATAVAAMALVGGVLAVTSVAITSPVDLAGYPVEEVDWLEARSLVADDQVRIAQRDYVGNYLTLRYGDRARVFMDDRFDFYPQAVLDDHYALLHGGDFATIAARNRFDVVLWATDSPFARWLDAADDWDIVLDGESWLVACRVTSPVHARCQR